MWNRRMSKKGCEIAWGEHLQGGIANGRNRQPVDLEILTYRMAHRNLPDPVRGGLLPHIRLRDSDSRGQFSCLRIQLEAHVVLVAELHGLPQDAVVMNLAGAR